MSSCIFEWDSGDLELLRQTKRNELMQKTGVRMPSQAAVSKAITNAEMARNCRRKTRGISVTTSKMRLKCDICTRLFDNFAVFPSRVISENDVDDVSS
ncbi:unnamed protein product [Clavelina lepadiformis]|uniref:Uncharacterized protein n=1 Tax=Clavelina lepadiformis TaxID=159417 RepID=A0ABP0G6H5_CLALP